MIDSIHSHTGGSIRLICLVLDLPRSSYHHCAKPTQTALEDVELGDLIEVIFREHRACYGYRRIHDELSDKKIICAPARVRRLMKERGLRALQPKNFIPKTSDGRADSPSPNRLLGEALPEEPNRVWAGDITFIPTSKGWLYLAVVIDLCSRKIVGWSIADHMRSDLVCQALRQALGSRSRIGSLIFHSDRGSQYGSQDFRRILQGAGIEQSMSARANPYHNAWTESFIGTLKNEMLRGGCFENSTDAQTELFAYIDAYYNIRRKHSSLGYLSPAQFESQNVHLN
jgi:putative transposase